MDTTPLPDPCPSPVWVKSGKAALGICCPLSRRKRTSRGRFAAPASCQKLTRHFYSITSSAIASSEAGIALGHDVSRNAAACRIKRKPRAPRAAPREDDGKCAPCPSYPPPARRSLRRVDGCRRRSSRIRPRRLARVQATATADCANPLHPYLRVCGRGCTTKPRSSPRGGAEDYL